MNNNAEQKPYLRSAENTVSLYEAAEIVFEQLKNNSENWGAITTLCEANEWLAIGSAADAETYDYEYFTNWLLREALGSMHYQTADLKLTEKFYSEITQGFGIQLEGDATPFLTRLGMLIRREVISKRLGELVHQFQISQFERRELEEKSVSEASLNKEGILAREIDRLQEIISKLEAIAIPR